MSLNHDTPGLNQMCKNAIAFLSLLNLVVNVLVLKLTSAVKTTDNMHITIVNIHIACRFNFDSSKYKGAEGGNGAFICIKISI